MLYFIKTDNNANATNMFVEIEKMILEHFGYNLEIINKNSIIKRSDFNCEGSFLLAQLMSCILVLDPKHKNFMMKTSSIKLNFSQNNY